METWTKLYGGDTQMPVVVSYYTDGFYRREAFELARSCQLFEQDFQIVRVPDQKDWVKNTNYKPTFLKEQAVQFPGRPILWLDADARLRKPLVQLKHIQEPIAYHVHLWPRGNKLVSEVLSGTVLLNPGPTRDTILTAWISKVDFCPTEYDQVSLAGIMVGLGVPHFELPEEYCFIYDLMAGKQMGDTNPLDAEHAIIEHTQSSRLFKRIVGRIYL